MIRAALVVGMLAAEFAAAQTIPYEPNYQFGSLIPFANNWEGPVALDLVSKPGGRTGKVFLRQTPGGLLIFARFSGRPPLYARSAGDTAGRAWVGLWLAESRRVAMPEIGWSNQFGQSTCRHPLPAAIDLENCASWEARQVTYREQLRRLFLRHWKLTPEFAVEDYATDAYQNLLPYTADRERANFTKLQPAGSPSMAIADSADFSTFEIFVKWSDFPPADDLQLSKIYLVLDLHGPDGAVATTAPDQKEGNPETFRELALERTREAAITPCGYALEGWYFSAGSTVEDTFALMNDPLGYQYAPASLSPVPVWTHHFSKSLASEEYACGPELRYVAGGKAFEPDGRRRIDATHLEVHESENGDHFLMSSTVAPYSPYGTGQCGSCPNLDFTIYHLSPGAGVTVALHIAFRLDAISDGEIRVSPDWEKVTVYKADRTPAWSSENYCRSGRTYNACGSGPSGAPEGPRRIQWRQ